MMFLVVTDICGKPIERDMVSPFRAQNITLLEGIYFLPF